MLVEKIGVAATLEQTAEECVELAHACMKLARETRAENPTFKDRKGLVDNLHEEVADVLICIDELQPDQDILNDWIEFKKARMAQRLKEV